jgi:hypothetical protein
MIGNKAKLSERGAEIGSVHVDTHQTTMIKVDLGTLRGFALVCKDTN